MSQKPSPSTSTSTSPNISQTLQKTREDFTARLKSQAAAPSSTGLQELKVAFLGKKGALSQVMASLRTVAKEDRPAVGKDINDLRQYIEGQLAELEAKVNSALLAEQLGGPTLDVTLPVAPYNGSGSLHPVSLMKNRLIREFHRLGFTVYDGPEVELDFYNFSALNFKDDHPARDEHDTFFVKGLDNTVLRTHTSSVQIHTMKGVNPPIRGVSMGRTYRCDSDVTHTPMFHQVEGIVVDKNISMADMKGVVDQFLKGIFGQNLATRLRPSYFPFVEPGGEVDLQCFACGGDGCRICSHSGWIEIGGLGMIHPNVFEACDLDSEIYSGFAFGFGIDRMAMLKFGINDLRVMFDGYHKFLEQFAPNEIGI